MDAPKANMGKRGLTWQQCTGFCSWSQSFGCPACASAWCSVLACGPRTPDTVLYLWKEDMGQEREEEIKPRIDWAGAAGGGGGHRAKPYWSSTMPPFSTQVCYFRKCCDRKVLFKDNRVTVSFPDANKPGLRFLSVTLSDLSLFLGGGGLNLPVNPLHEGALFFPSFLFIFFRVLSPRGSLPKILSPDKTISKQPSHQSPQRQCGLEARALVQGPEGKCSLHRRPAGIIHYWRQLH